MTLKIGAIGAGAIGQDHIRRITRTLRGAEVVAVTDIDGARARAVVSTEGLDARVFDTGHDVIAAPDVDAVLVSSWGPSHAEFVLASIAAGKPVFCEKPLATTAADCRSIVDAEISGGTQLVQVGFMRRYDRGYRALKQTIDRKVIGEPLMVHCAHRNASVAANYAGDMSVTDTFIHEIDVLRWLLDDDYVSAQVIVPRGTSLAAAGLQDPIFILLETRSGIRIDAEVFVNCRYGYDIQCQVVGELGIASLPDPESVVLRKDAALSTTIMTDWKLRFIDSYDVELQEWIDATLAGEMRGPSAWDGYFAAVTADACIAAKHSGQIVPITVSDRPSFYDAPRRSSSAV